MFLDSLKLKFLNIPAKDHHTVQRYEDTKDIATKRVDTKARDRMELDVGAELAHANEMNLSASVQSAGKSSNPATFVQLTA